MSYLTGVHGILPVTTGVATINPVMVGGSDYAGTPLLQTLKVDSLGRINTRSSTTTTAAWTNATALNTALTVVNNDFSYATATVTMRIVGTITAQGLSFERSSDGTNWFNAPFSFVRDAIFGAPAGLNYSTTAYTSFTGTGITSIMEVALQGWPYFRIRLNPVITGAGTLNLSCTAHSAPKGVFIEGAVPISGTVGVAPAGLFQVFGGDSIGSGPSSGTMTVGGLDGSSLVRSLPVSVIGATPPLNVLQVGGRGGGVSTALATDSQGALALGTPLSPSGDGQSNSIYGFFDPVGISYSALGTMPFVFNGTTWDRQRGNVDTVTGDTGAHITTFAGATQTNFNGCGAFITILLGTVSGTSPTLSAQVQWSPDGGTTWINLGAALANLTATSQKGVFVVYPNTVATTTGATQTLVINTPLPRTWRINYTIAGTTPSFTISSVNVNYIL